MRLEVVGDSLCVSKYSLDSKAPLHHLMGSKIYHQVFHTSSKNETRVTGIMKVYEFSEARVGFTYFLFFHLHGIWEAAFIKLWLSISRCAVTVSLYFSIMFRPVLVLLPTALCYFLSEKHNYSTLLFN